MIRCLLAALFATAAYAAEPVTIGVSSRSFNPGYANMWIGIPLGLYGPALAAQAVGTAGITENLQLMLSGRVTMSTGTQDVILAAQSEGRVLPAVIPCVYLRGMIQRVEVLQTSPIQSYPDLKDKRIGVPTLAVGQVPYIKYAEHSLGVDPDGIRFIAVGNGQPALAALTSGQVDALANTDVDVAGFQSVNAPIRVLPQPSTMETAAVGYAFVFARPWYNAHKAEAAALLQGMIKAVVVILENPEAAVRISFHMHPESIPAGIPLDQAVRDAVTANQGARARRGTPGGRQQPLVRILRAVMGRVRRHARPARQGGCDAVLHAGTARQDQRFRRAEAARVGAVAGCARRRSGVPGLDQPPSRSGLMPTHASYGKPSAFFFEKKNQKTFDVEVSVAAACSEFIGVFCFFSAEKKTCLFLLKYQRHHGLV